jgi:hypothetical protein
LAVALISTLIGAQDYQISFDIFGDNEAAADSVVVHNIQQGSMITMGVKDILHLVASITGTAGWQEK